MPRETLTREQILRAAVEVLDAEGVAGLNIRRLGTQLGVASTAMYYYVKSKDELVTLAADLVWHEIELPDPDKTEWRSAAAMLAREVFGMIDRHFWLMPAMSTHLIHGPGKVRFDECSLGVFESAGFRGRDADRAAATVLMFVIGAAQGSAAERASQARLRQEGAEGTRLRDILTYISESAAQFPRLRSRMDSSASGSIETISGDEGFEFGLHTVLDGLQSRLASGQEK
ncbi:TetR/AcrR family transcriptional regulator [Nocardia brasiliensis]|uniref:TetR/AcrR family transcriptional regulator n=1 Tax=Nocardia brasiliensis TaxID=37326 RepID=UPI0024561D27|nr:TetR/AcrR family transcriptional regulator [Nocardia brasiliensis]